ncbi:hypothetical protein MLD38_035449 [Melastoma candidum]|uniref:Uncharacterized protein n=1 Tax=Melastoma candidum TaxID=119954 RepID=A0ACB9LG75_9MYRT|nr:hypothetical protein MLD38_035449 [Melastoma candidum]
MDWDGNNSSFRNFVSVASDHSSSIGFLYDYHHNTSASATAAAASHFPSTSAGAILMGDHGNHHEAHVGILANYGGSHGHLQHLHGGNNNDQKKKKLRSDQLELLENSFQEEIKLDPDRKLRLSRELGLQPRQIAVWFQNRRARWKAKQLERLYDALKAEFDSVSREKQELQEEVLKLKAMVSNTEMSKKHPSAAGQTEISGEETVESVRNSNEVARRPMATDLMMNATGSSNHRHHQHQHHVALEPSYQLQNVQESYNMAAAVMNSYWGGSGGGLPSYP